MYYQTYQEIRLTIIHSKRKDRENYSTMLTVPPPRISYVQHIMCSDLRLRVSIYYRYRSRRLLRPFTSSFLLSWLRVFILYIIIDVTRSVPSYSVISHLGLCEQKPCFGLYNPCRKKSFTHKGKESGTKRTGFPYKKGELSSQIRIGVGWFVKLKTVGSRTRKHYILVLCLT